MIKKMLVVAAIVFASTTIFAGDPSRGFNSNYNRGGQCGGGRGGHDRTVINNYNCNRPGAWGSAEKAVFWRDTAFGIADRVLTPNVIVAPSYPVGVAIQPTYVNGVFIAPQPYVVNVPTYVVPQFYVAPQPVYVQPPVYAQPPPAVGQPQQQPQQSLIGAGVNVGGNSNGAGVGVNANVGPVGANVGVGVGR